MGTSRVSVKTSPNPKYSANNVSSLWNDLNCAESPLKTGGFNFQGIPLASDSPAGPWPLALALELHSKGVVGVELDCRPERAPVAVDAAAAGEFVVPAGATMMALVDGVVQTGIFPLSQPRWHT